LLLEDFRILREELAGFLADCGHVVAVAEDICAFERLYRRGNYAVLVVDIGLPDGDGLYLVERLREQGDRVGVIVLTSRAGHARKIEGFTRGADHYLTKPVDLDELNAVITSLSRRIVLPRAESPEKPQWVIDAVQRCLTPPDSHPIELTAQGLTVLATIAEGHGSVVSRRTVVEALGADYVQYDFRRLDSQIYLLRKTVRDVTGLDLPVRSARGLGYQVTAEFCIR